MSEMATPVDVKLEGLALLTDPLLNKGSAFTEEERTAFGLHGLLPPHISTLDEQITRRLRPCGGSRPISSVTCFCAVCRT
jgi:malate dehydrogenase (oxaloacetate-decarboxylating)